MAKLSKKAILSARDSVKNASEKLTKIAQDMVETETAPDPAQVKEVVESIADVAKEIVQQAETVAEGLEEIVGDEAVVEGAEHENGEKLKNAENDKKPPDDEKLKDMTAKIDEQDEEIDELKKFKEVSEKEKMANEYAKLFPSNQQSAKFTEFMKMDKPNSELSTVLGATENVLKSVQKVASMKKTNETIIFTDGSKQKQASMSDLSGTAKTLTEI